MSGAGRLALTDPGLARAVCLLVPAMAVLAAALWRRPGRRALAGALLATAWSFTALFGVHLLAGRFGWWSFSASGALLDGLPVDVWIGWALLWGALPHLAAPRAPVAMIVVAATWLDLLLMPLLSGILTLAGNGRWLVGELVAAAVVLVPALLLGRWTERDRRLGARVVLQVLLAGGLALWLLPTAALGGSGELWQRLATRPAWQLSLTLQVVAVPLVVALAAVQELAERGRGTPVPYDPPRGLVTSGPYAYLRNPMQAGLALTLLGMAALLASWELTVAALLAIVYGAGLAEWHEHQQLERRFGAEWSAYRAAVRPWWPRWRPYVPEGEGAVLHVAATCVACTQVGTWFAGQRPVRLTLRPAELGLAPLADPAGGSAPAAAPAPEACPLPSAGGAGPKGRAGAPWAGGLRRLTYLAADGSASDGVRALAHGLNHINLGWAALGWLGRLPGVVQVIQLFADAVGAGPRTLDPSRPWRAPWATDGRDATPATHRSPARR